MRALVTALVLLVVLAGSALAQGVCGPRAGLVEYLASLGERQVGRGERPNGAVIEIWSMDDGKTWTIFVSLPDGGAMPPGAACVLANGENLTIEPLGLGL